MFIEREEAIKKRKQIKAGNIGIYCAFMNGSQTCPNQNMFKLFNIMTEVLHKNVMRKSVYFSDHVRWCFIPTPCLPAY